MLSILSETQSGFRGGRYTGTCMVEFLDKIYRVIDCGGVSEVLFLVLAMAFNTVDHIILLKKLTSFGFRYSLTSWFAS